MLAFNVVVKGEDGGRFFLTMFEVAATSQAQAQRIALSEAARLGLNVQGVEEVEEAEAEQELIFDHPQLLRSYGKAYYDSED